jgi:hypothetical protein
MLWGDFKRTRVEVCKSLAFRCRPAVNALLRAFWKKVEIGRVRGDHSCAMARVAAPLVLWPVADIWITEAADRLAFESDSCPPRSASRYVFYGTLLGA